MNVSLEDVNLLSRNFWSVPVVGLFYGLVAGGSFFLFNEVFSSLISAVLVVMLVHGLNRFLHFDGLIDLGDGLVATGAQEKRLAAMKDTRVGAGGVSFGLLFTLLLVSALSSLPYLLFFLPLAMEVLAKNALLTAAALGKEREGLGSPFVRNTKRGAVVPSALLSAALLVPVAFLTSPSSFAVSGLVVLISIMVAASFLTGLVTSSVATRAFGCVNGDVLGATNEIAKSVVLLTALAVLPWLL